MALCPHAATAITHAERATTTDERHVILPIDTAIIQLEKVMTRIVYALAAPRHNKDPG
jgi:hypothetical protein